MIIEFEIPLLERVKISETRQKKYFEFSKSESLPKKYTDRIRYTWVTRKTTLCLFDNELQQFVIKNSKSLDKPRYNTINGQDIYNGNVHAQSRALLVNKIHEYIKENITGKLSIFPLEVFPIKYELVFHKIFKDTHTMDVDNHWIYEKCFQDTLTEMKLIPDDSVQYINSRASSIKLVSTVEEQKIVIKITLNNKI